MIDTSEQHQEDTPGAEIHGRRRLAPLMLLGLAVIAPIGGGALIWSKLVIPLAAAEDQLSSLRPELARAKTDLAEAHSQWKAAREEVNLLKSYEAAAHLKDKTDSLKAESERLEAEIEAGTNARMALNNTIAALKIEIVKISLNAKEANARLDETRSEREDLLRDFNSRKRQLLLMSKRAEELKASVQKQNAADKVIKARTNELKKELDAVKMDVEALEKLAEAQKEALAALGGRLLKATEQLSGEHRKLGETSEKLEKFRLGHLERLKVIRREYVIIAARNAGRKKARYREIAEDVNAELKELKSQKLQPPAEIGEPKEIAAEIKKLLSELETPVAPPE
ncbi:MAG: hypothetical protein HQ503_14235 [Rhodospirillales bacterium]|nr:hypothetical protein [Rhodospirillales bacterium]